jgi:lipopolysaccharide export system protein LptC
MSLQTPVFVIPPKRGSGQAPWVVRSRSGWVSAEGDELRLRDDVVASSRNTAGRPVKMTTEQLNVFPDAKRATSPVAVTVTQPGSILRGVGMEALLDSKRVRLKSNVRIRYAPPR